MTRSGSCRRSDSVPRDNWRDTTCPLRSRGRPRSQASRPETNLPLRRYRLYEIDLIINRTLVYGSLTAALASIYFGGIVVMQRVFVALTGEKSTLAVVASTLLIAALFSL